MRARRGYQTETEEVIDFAATGTRTPMVAVSPTGSGKTVIIMGAARRALARRQRVIIGVHRDHLVVQTANQALADGLSYGIIKSGYPEAPHEMLQIASIHTLSRRKNYPPADLVVGDECHIANIQAFLNNPAYAGSMRVGTTATPEMHGGETLHETFRHMHIAAKPSALLEAGHITNCRIWCPGEPDLSHVRMLRGDYSDDDLEKLLGTSTVTRGAVDTWMKLAMGKPTICFTVNRRHSEAVKKEFTERGISAAIIDGEMGDDARAIILAQMANGRIQVLINVSIFCEGYDLPSLECVLMLRPTKSLGSYLQMCGRGCRSSPGKANYLLLDFAGNVIRHRAPHIDRLWTLDAEHAKALRRENPAQAVKRCPDCFFIWSTGAQCPACGTKRLAKFVRYNDKEMVEVTDEANAAGPALLPSGQQAKEAIDNYRKSLFAKYRNMPPSKRFIVISQKVSEFAKTLGGQ